MTDRATDDLPGVLLASATEDYPEIRVIPVDALLPDGADGALDPENAMVHSDAEIARLTGSILSHGMLETVTYNRATRQLVGGHGRLEAAQKAGKRQVVVLVTDMDWTEQRLANIDLNGQYGHWDEERLTEQLRALRATLEEDLTDALAAFGPSRLEQLLPELASAAEVEPPESFKSFGSDIDTEYRCPKCGYEWSGSPT